MVKFCDGSIQVRFVGGENAQAVDHADPGKPKPACERVTPNFGPSACEVSIGIGETSAHEEASDRDDEPNTPRISRCPDVLTILLVSVEFGESSRRIG